MPKLRVSAFSISLDGYSVGSDQGRDNPLGRGGEDLHQWFLPTRTFQRMAGKGDGTAGIDDDFAAQGFANVGAWIMGAKHVRAGAWSLAGRIVDGWWGDNPPYHVPVFVLTNHARASLEMNGGTVFHFVTDGIVSALARAAEAAGGRDVRLGGGVATIRQYLHARLIDEMHVAVAPILLGGGELLFAGIDLPALGYAVTKHVPSEQATYVVLAKRD